MTKHLREWLGYQMYKHGLSHQSLANKIEITGRHEKRHPSRQYVRQIANGEAGKMPDIWQELLSALGHTIVVVPKNKVEEVITAITPIIDDDVPPAVLKAIGEDN